MNNPPYIRYYRTENFETNSENSSLVTGSVFAYLESSI